jgi:hypothetical protein
MPIDPRIALGVRPLQVEQPVNLLSQAMNLQGLQQRNALGDMQLQDARRSRENEAALGEAYRQAYGQDGKLDQNALMLNLARSGLGSRIPGLQKQLLDTENARLTGLKTTADTAKANAETANKALATQRDMLTLVRTPEQFAQWVDGMYTNPATASVAQSFGTPEQVKSRIPTDPQQFATFLQQNAMGMDKFIQNQTSVRGQDLSAQTSRANNANTVAATMRGQNMTDARSRESNQAGRVPAGYRATADGTLEFIPGGPADPNAAKRAAPTEFQGKSATFGTRAEAADKIISSLTGKYSPAAINSKQALGKVWGIGGALEAGGNLALSSDDQRAEQAQRDFVNATLRQESGAAIADSEFNNAVKQYFPQPGDSKAVIAQKAANRKLVVEGFKNNAGRALKGIEKQQQESGGASGNFADDSDPLGLRQ